MAARCPAQTLSTTYCRGSESGCATAGGATPYSHPDLWAAFIAVGA